MSNEPLKRACDKAGGQSKLARLIGTRQSRIWYWLEKSERGVAPEFVLSIEEKTGVSRHELRPDLYPVSEEART